MQVFAHPTQHDLLELAWRTFVQSGRLDASQAGPNPLVWRSWQRCAPLLDAQAQPRPAVLKGDRLSRLLTAHANLLINACPLMEDIHQFTEGSDCAVILADGTACVLSSVGAPNMLEMLRQLDMQPGVYWDEGHMGTNALALALLEAVPVQVIGAEHYFKCLHDFACSAAPIYDVSGRAVGVVALAGRQGACYTHTLTTVMATARAISNQLQTDSYLQEANRRLAELNSLFEAISEGVISWNKEGKITYLNTQVGEILNLNPLAARGRRLEDKLKLPAAITQAIEKSESLRDVEAELVTDGHSINCMVSLQPIFEGLKGPVGYIATLRPLQQVRQLVHRIVGSQATLTLEDVQGNSAKIRQVRHQVRIAARGTAPVLLHGEDGVGKNPLARAIHTESTRRNGPFVAISCATLPLELMATEILGYDKAPYKAGGEGRLSKFELADSGTLFLDEVENLSLEMQSTLLYVIDTAHVMRLNGNHPIPVNVRIMAATSVNLEPRVDEGSFLPDLYRRFGVFTIDLPALRERIEDISLLVERFLARITQRMECAAFISDEALEILCRYPWPGNIRELENVLERAVAASDEGVIRPHDLPAIVHNPQAFPPGAHHPQPVLTLDQAEREAIMRAGWACQGQITAMAHQLSIGRTTLWRKLKALQLDPLMFKR